MRSKNSFPAIAYEEVMDFDKYLRSFFIDSLLFHI